MKKSILIVHTERTISKILADIIKKLCGDVLKKRNWQNVQIKEAESIEEAMSLNRNCVLLIAHLNSVESDSEDITNIYKLRMQSIGVPIIAIAFSDQNAHKVFTRKGHSLLVYPFGIEHLKKALHKIKPLEPKTIKGFLKRTFSDIVCD